MQAVRSAIRVRAEGVFALTANYPASWNARSTWMSVVGGCRGEIDDIAGNLDSRALSSDRRRIDAYSVHTYYEAFPRGTESS
jgi:hypothetical protein